MNKITTTSAAALMALTLFGMAQPIVSHADQINNAPATHQNNIQNKADTDVVTIPDANLKEAVKTALGVTDDAEITVAKMKGTWPQKLIISKTVTSFSGMENATGLKEMKINANLDGIGSVDFTPLEQITFSTFDIAGADISQEQFNHIHFDKAGLAINLANFGNPVGYNHIYNLTALSGTKLTWSSFANQLITETAEIASGGNLTLNVKDIKNIDGSTPTITPKDGGVLSSDGKTITWTGLADTVNSVSYSWTGGSFSGTVTVPVTVVPKQADTSSDVNISYDYTAPTPADPGWYSVVPADVAFTDQNKDVDTSVKLVNDDNDHKTPYSGAKKVKVTVQSVNGYKLKDQAVPEADVAYKLDKDGKNTTFFDANDTVQDLGALDKDHTSIASKAHLTGTATKTGKYIDTLHYVFAETD